MSKGSKQRPRQIGKREWDLNYDRIFKLRMCRICDAQITINRNADNIYRCDNCGYVERTIIRKSACELLRRNT